MPVVRHAVRVLVIDPLDRVLLFASKDDGGRTFWVPPGGGGEPGETVEETARRELREETGLAEVRLEAEIWRRRHIVAWGGVTYDARERWFLARPAAFTVETDGLTDLERRTIVEHRWWTVDELRAATDRLVPTNLAELVAGLLRDGPPTRPVDVGK